MSRAITAKRNDGTPVQRGDRVLLVYKSGFRTFGRVVDIGPCRRFASLRYALLQIYTVHCQDGHERKAHAWQIKRAAQRWKRSRRKK